MTDGEIKLLDKRAADEGRTRSSTARQIIVNELKAAEARRIVDSLGLTTNAADIAAAAPTLPDDARALLRGTRFPGESP